MCGIDEDASTEPDGVAAAPERRTPATDPTSPVTARFLLRFDPEEAPHELLRVGVGTLRTTGHMETPRPRGGLERSAVRLLVEHPYDHPASRLHDVGKKMPEELRPAMTRHVADARSHERESSRGLPVERVADEELIAPLGKPILRESNELSLNVDPPWIEMDTVLSRPGVERLHEMTVRTADVEK